MVNSASSTGVENDAIDKDNALSYLRKILHTHIRGVARKFSGGGLKKNLVRK